MSIVSKSILRQISRLNHLPVHQQAILPFSTGVRRLADSTSSNENVKDTSTANQSYDSVRTYEKTSIDTSHRNFPFDFSAVHLGSLGKLVMVLGGLYKRVGDVPDTIPYVIDRLFL